MKQLYYPRHNQAQALQPLLCLLKVPTTIAKAREARDATGQKINSFKFLLNSNKNKNKNLQKVEIKPKVNFI